MGSRAELESIRGKVDQSLTGHSILKEKFSRRAFILDLTLLILSAGITFLAIASDFLKSVLLPSALDANMLLTLFAFLAFIASILQLRTGWKERSAAHSEAAKGLARFKHELSKALSGNEKISDDILIEHLSYYQYLNDNLTKIPDRSFLHLKKAHREKVAISKHLDRYPSSSVFLIKVRFFMRDNFGVSFRKGNNATNEGGDIDI